MAAIVYLNGKFLSELEAFIPAADRGFLFGDGVFTTIKVVEGEPEFLGLHLEKWERDCKTLGIVPRRIARKVIDELIQKNEAQAGIWRLKILISGGEGPEFNLGKRSEGSLLMTLKPYKGQPSPCRLIVYPYPVCRPLAAIKTLAFADLLWMADYAVKQGYDDAIVCDPQGMILETSVANVFWRQGNNLFFPNLSLPLYPGITLQVILKIAEKMNLGIHPIKARLEEISTDAQFYLCNSMKGIVPVVSIGEKKFERDPSFENSLHLAFQQALSMRNQEGK